MHNEITSVNQPPFSIFIIFDMKKIKSRHSNGNKIKKTLHQFHFHSLMTRTINKTVVITIIPVTVIPYVEDRLSEVLKINTAKIVESLRR